MFVCFLLIVSAICMATESSNPSPPQNAKVINHVILISVDGLRPELLQAPLIEKHPSMARLLRGPHTFEFALFWGEGFEDSVAIQMAETISKKQTNITK